MGKEIERKFLVDMALWTPRHPGVLYRQGYLSTHKERTVRVRICGDTGFITVKGITKGITRSEFEYEIPLKDARKLLAMCEQLIEKTRYTQKYRGKRWEIDVFHGKNHGLVVAEIELRRPGQEFPKPDWVTEDVSMDSRYFNANLVDNPYSSWGQ